MSLAVRGVVPIVPGAPVNAKCSDIRAGAVACVVACLTLSQFYIPLFRHWVVPVLLSVSWCRY